MWWNNRTDVLIEYSQLLKWTAFHCFLDLMHIKIRQLGWEKENTGRRQSSAEQPPGVTFVCAMRFVVLYTWIKETCPQSVCEKVKVKNLHFWVAFGFMFIGNPEEKSINPSFQLQKRNRRWDCVITGSDSHGHQQSTVCFPQKVKGQQHHSTTSQQETCSAGFYCVVKV